MLYSALFLRNSDVLWGGGRAAQHLPALPRQLLCIHARTPRGPLLMSSSSESEREGGDVLFMSSIEPFAPIMHM